MNFLTIYMFRIQLKCKHSEVYMNTKHLIKDAAIELELRVGSDTVLSVITARVLNILSNTINTLKSNSENLVSVPDQDLMVGVISALNTQRAMVSERELKKEQKRLVAKNKFYTMLENHGGLLKSGDVALKLGVSRQTIKNQRDSGKILSIREGNDYLFPAFQFSDSGKLAFFEQVLLNLVNLEGITKCSFFLTKIEMLNGERKSPLEILQKGVNQQELDYLLREASLFGQHTAS